jgi:hypothetical protein
VNFWGQSFLPYIIIVLSLIVGLQSIIAFAKYQKQLVSGQLADEAAGEFKTRFNLYGSLYLVVAVLVILASYTIMSDIMLIMMLIMIGGGIYNLLLVNKKNGYDLADLRLLRWNGMILLAIAIVYVIITFIV